MIESIFIKPFYQGFQNINAGWHGRKVDHITEDLNLLERIAHIAVGLLLLVPIVNAVVFAILDCLHSPFVFQKTWSCAACLSGGATEIPTDMEVLIERRSGGEALVHEAYVRPREPVATQAEYERRKRQCIARMDALLPERMRVRAEIENYNLDGVLRPFSPDYAPGRFREFYEFAEYEQRAQMDGILRGYHEAVYGQTLAAKRLLSRLYDFLSQKQPLFEGTDQENLFKAQIRDIFDKIQDAHTNCIDQVNSQLETILVDVIADFESANGNRRTLREHLVQRAAFRLFRYKAALIKEICLKEYPREDHAADLERAVKNRLRNELGLRGEIFEEGSVVRFYTLEDIVNNVRSVFLRGTPHGNHIPDDLDRNYQLNRQAYLRQVEERRRSNKYSPENYLMNHLSIYHGNERTLRADLLIWVREYFNLEGNDPLTQEFIRAVSVDPDHTIEDGGDIQPWALFHFLNTIGILQ